MGFLRFAILAMSIQREVSSSLGSGYQWTGQKDKQADKWLYKRMFLYNMYFTLMCKLCD